MNPSDKRNLANKINELAKKREIMLNEYYRMLNDPKYQRIIEMENRRQQNEKKLKELNFTLDGKRADLQQKQTKWNQMVKPIINSVITQPGNVGNSTNGPWGIHSTTHQVVNLTTMNGSQLDITPSFDSISPHATNQSIDTITSKYSTSSNESNSNESIPTNESNSTKSKFDDNKQSNSITNEYQSNSNITKFEYQSN